MNFSPLRFGPLRLLLILATLLAFSLTWMWFDEKAKPRQLNWVAPKALAPELRVPANPPRSNTGAASFSAILERPLFAPDRRPPPPPAPPAPPPPPDPLANIRIQGIFSGTNAGILARIEGKSRRIKINEAVGAWTLKSIEGRDVTFSRGEENRQLQLAYARLDTPPPAPPPTASHAAPPASAAPGAVAPVAAAQGTASIAQKTQDEVRARLERRNQLRTSRGLPPLTE